MAVKTATAVKKVRELSEEDVLKAPDKDYMNEAQLAFFKRKLIELRDQLLQNADDTGEHLRENEVGNSKLLKSFEESHDVSDHGLIVSKNEPEQNISVETWHGVSSHQRQLRQ